MSGSILNSSNDNSDSYNSLVEELNIEQNKYVRYKILQEAANECIVNIDSTLGEKVKHILMESSCAQVAIFSNKQFDQEAARLFGILTQDDNKLSYSEDLKLKKAMQQSLENKYNSICKQFYNITKENIEKVPWEDSSLDLTLSSEDCSLMELQTKLNKQKEKYFDLLLEQQDLLESLTNIRLEKLPDIVCNKKLQDCDLKLKMNSLRAEIVEQKTRVDLFAYSKNSIRAYREVIQDIKEQQIENQNEVDRLLKLKEKYKKIECKQFNEILKSYTQYKSAIEKKKMIYDCMKN